MKYSLFALISLMIGCSSTPDKGGSTSAPKVSESAFKQEKPLTNNQVSDYYTMEAKGMNPALQDETLDRHSSSEASSLATDSDPLVSLAVKCAQKDFSDAFELAGKMFNKYQKIATYWNQVASCHLNQGSHRKALLFYNKALELNPNFVPALNNIGVLYVRTGQDQKALVAFERANKQGRFAKTPRYNLARLYLTYGLNEQALNLFNPLLQSSPEDADLLNAVASAYFLKGNHQEAMSYYQRIPKSLWSNPEVGLNISLVLKKLGQGKEAQSVFDTISKPKSGDLSRYYSTVKAQLGENG